MRNVRVASVQFEHLNGDRAANLQIIESFVTSAADQDVEMIVFPECCITGYWFLRNLSRNALVALAEPVPDGESSQVLFELAQLHNMAIGAGLIEIAADGSMYNTYVVALPDGTIHSHRKIHCFISEHLSSGNAFTVFDTPMGCRMGVLICYDNNIIENVRITALLGAEILLAPHQTGGCESISPLGMKRIDTRLWKSRKENPEALAAEFSGPNGRAWLMRWLPSRAHDNGLFLIFSNGVGIDDNEVRTGNAMIIDPYGRIITETCKAGDDMVCADLDASLRDACTGLRWNMSRRPELYGRLTKPTGQERDIRAVRFGETEA